MDSWFFCRLVSSTPTWCPSSPLMRRTRGPGTSGTLSRWGQVRTLSRWGSSRWNIIQVRIITIQVPVIMFIFNHPHYNHNHHNVIISSGSSLAAEVTVTLRATLTGSTPAWGEQGWSSSCLPCHHTRSTTEHWYWRILGLTRRLRMCCILKIVKCNKVCGKVKTVNHLAKQVKLMELVRVANQVK